ncbi:hypothetical protein BDN72DRAFT_940406 [Pluteus cervinus]|uniref:Uncharacterized protein n=1 Tax=Pluteus cervinus TaxID=181527 RepID=A0ACD3AXN8_9AGAR|nr:hypothetical protein BDN72DRAFT_940406 [Pluteus cervinus]
MFLYLYLVFVAFTAYATPIPLVTSDAIPPLADVPSDCGPTARTMPSIVHICVLTIWTCIYASLHHNVPHPDATQWQILRGRLNTCFYALIAPEGVIWWASRQHLGAHEIASKMNSKWPELKWTTTHGHFVQMGGLEGIHSDGRREVIDPLCLDIEVEQGNIDLSNLRFSKKQIEDSSKNNFFAKAIAILQTSWFILRFIDCFYRHLPVEHLEIVTFALALLNIITYILWWNKPFNIDCQRTVPIKNLDPSLRSTLLQDNQLDNPSLAGPSDVNLEHWTVVSFDSSPPRQFEGGGQQTNDGNGQQDSEDHTTDEADSKTKGGIWPSLCWGLRWVCDRLIVRSFLALALPFRDMIECEEIDQGARHVPVFYAHPIPRRVTVQRVRNTACFIGSTFGAFHLLAWNSHFPTRVESFLWWGSTFVIVVIPYSLILIGINKEAARFVAYYPGPILYILARLLLVTIAFIAIRDPQPGICQTTSWSTYIPHLDS